MNIKAIPTLLFVLTMSTATTGDATVRDSVIAFQSIEQKIDRGAAKAEKTLRESLDELKEVGKQFDTLKTEVDKAIGKYRYHSDTIPSAYPGENQIWTIRFKWDTIVNEWVFDTKYRTRITFY